MASIPSSSHGLSLPRPAPGRQQQQQQQQQSLLAGTSPGASTAQAPSLPSERSSRAAGEQQQPRRTKKKKQGRGRMMMVKVFYSLSSPRFGGAAPSPTPTTPAVTTPSSAFLSVHDLAHVGAAPSPSPEPERPSQQSYTCLARLSAPVWVQLMGSKPVAGGEERTEYGKLTLKTCLSAICISRPELVTDPSKDYAVSAVDPYESSLQPSSHASTSGASLPNAGSGGQGLMEGKGMLSWNLAEKREGTTWVCGRVSVDEREMESRRRKRRKLEQSVPPSAEEDDEDSDDEGVKETLEVWLQLVERPSFTQTQFLTSLRSFANPSQPHDTSDRASSPPPRRDSFHHQQGHPSSAQPRSSHLGDPVKRKRPRESDEHVLPVSLPAAIPTPPSAASTPFPIPVASTSTLPSAPTAAQLQDPRILALLVQLIPSLAASAPAASAPPLSLESEQAQALLPAIRTLAEYYGAQLPPTLSASAPAELNSAQAILEKALSQQPASSLDKGKGKPGPKPGKRVEQFAPIDAPETSDKSNPIDNSACSNCKRKKSTKWREAFDEEGTRVTVCNACGVFYNKNGFHRNKVERATSPNRAPSSSIGGPSTTKPVGRPLQGRLTATCEQELRKFKGKKVKGNSPGSSHRPGMLPPPSPSKVVGPSLSRSPGTGAWTAWGHRATVPSHTMTSPGRSPRRGGRGGAGLFGMTATSPVRANPNAGTGAGLRSGYESDGDGRGTSFSFGGAGSIFGAGPQSPSPKRKAQRQMPAYLLTASPGTALDRILNDTNIDLNSFDVEMPDAVEMTSGKSGSGSSGEEPAREERLALTEDEEEQGAGGLSHALSFYLRDTSPDLKENAKPSALNSNEIKQGASSIFDMALDPALRDIGASTSALGVSGNLNTTDAPTTDLDPFESVLSSLRRDFNTRLSSNALTAPSSPIPSSPCVQPRTSSATPGSKGKAPQSCGRPAPSILHGFIDGLVPALAMDQAEGETPVSDSDAWTPASPTELDAFHSNPYDLSHLDPAPRASGSSKLLIPNRGTSTSNSFLPSHLVATSDVASEFDFGSLPPSSPPLLPSEAFPTPSEFDSGITPDEEGYLASEDADQTITLNEHSQVEGGGATTAEQKALSALLRSLGAGVGGAAAEGTALEALLGGQGGDKIQLDRSTVNKLLQMISSRPNQAPSPSGTSTTSSKPSPAYLAPPSASDSTANSPNDQVSPALIAGAEEPFDLFKSFEDATKKAAEEGGEAMYEAMFAGL